MTDDVLEIQKQNAVNQECYTAYKEKQDLNFFKKMIEEQHKLKLALKQTSSEAVSPRVFLNNTDNECSRERSVD